jgi:hypothetical protein
MTMSDYINRFLPKSTEAKDLIESLSSVDDIEDLNIGNFTIRISLFLVKFILFIFNFVKYKNHILLIL